VSPTLKEVEAIFKCVVQTQLAAAKTAFYPRHPAARSSSILGFDDVQRVRCRAMIGTGRNRGFDDFADLLDDIGLNALS